MIREILIHPDPRLKTICKPVDDIDSVLRALADDMLETMYDAPGIGLAAPQIGILRRLFVMDCARDEPPEPIVMINPKILWASEDLVVQEEGCLSIPDQYGEVERASAIHVSWTNPEGEQNERGFDGIRAICIQHEIDHLDGKLFIDYLGPLKRQMITRKMQKLKRERARHHRQDA